MNAPDIQPRTPFVILSIDGGGIRGALPARFLALLERDLGEPLQDHFDYVCGTSAGGLIALYLAGVGGTAHEASRLFSSAMAGRIMDKSLMDRAIPPSLQWKPVYDGKGKRAVLEQVFGDRRLQDVRTPVLITAYDPIQRRITAFKSHGGGDGAANPLLYQVADATSAAPMYFPPAAVGDAPERWLIDGGVAANNPSMAALAEAIRAGIPVQDIVLVSLGTGRNPASPEAQADYQQHARHWGGLEWLKHGIVDHIMDGASTGVDYWCRQILGERYFRVQGPTPGASAKIDDVSPHNIHALEQVADDWYAEFGPALLALLAPKIERVAAPTIDPEVPAHAAL
jgi:uncharacterized protein